MLLPLQLEKTSSLLPNIKTFLIFCVYVVTKQFILNLKFILNISRAASYDLSVSLHQKASLRERCTDILIFFKIICFTQTIMANSFLVPFVLRYSEVELQRTKVSKLFPNISLQKNILTIIVEKNQAAVFSISSIPYLFEISRHFMQIQPHQLKYT